jgi:hypothetical protein
MRVPGVARQVLVRQSGNSIADISESLRQKQERVACNRDGKERKNEKLCKVSLVGLVGD